MLELELETMRFYGLLAWGCSHAYPAPHLLFCQHSSLTRVWLAKKTSNFADKGGWLDYFHSKLWKTTLYGVVSERSKLSKKQEWKIKTPVAWGCGLDWRKCQTNQTFKRERLEIKEPRKLSSPHVLGWLKNWGHAQRKLSWTRT